MRRSKENEKRKKQERETSSGRGIQRKMEAKQSELNQQTTVSKHINIHFKTGEKGENKRYKKHKYAEGTFEWILQNRAVCSFQRLENYVEGV